MRASLALALLALLALPAVSASTVDVAFSDTFGLASLHADGTLDGAEASQVRGYMDLAGDRNGTVTEDEAQSFVHAYKSVIGKQVGAMLTGGNFTLDGAQTQPEIGSLAMQGAAGPVHGGGPVAFQLNMTLLFQAVGNATHTLRMVGHTTPGGAMRMTLALPAGWHVANATGVEGVATGAEARSAAFDMPTHGEAMAFTFARDPVKTSPAYGAIPALAAIATALLALRGRNGGRPSRHRALPAR